MNIKNLYKHGNKNEEGQQSAGAAHVQSNSKAISKCFWNKQGNNLWYFVKKGASSDRWSLKAKAMALLFLPQSSLKAATHPNQCCASKGRQLHVGTGRRRTNKTENGTKHFTTTLNRRLGQQYQKSLKSPQRNWMFFLWLGLMQFTVRTTVSKSSPITLKNLQKMDGTLQD